MHTLVTHPVRRIGACKPALCIRLHLLCPNAIETEPCPNLLRAHGKCPSLSFGPQVLPRPVKLLIILDNQWKTCALFLLCHSRPAVLVIPCITQVTLPFPNPL
jgi:hypothetical protein